MALSWLLLNAGDVVRPESLVSVLWEQPSATALPKAKAIVRELLALLDADSVEVHAAGFRIDPDAHEFDASTFERLCGEATARALAGDHVEAMRLWREGLSLWRGPAYPDLADALPAAAGIERLDAMRLNALEELNALALRAPVDYDVVGELRAQTIQHPERLRLRCQLALALYRTERQVEALTVLREARAALGDHGSHIADLEAAILQHRAELGSSEWLVWQEVT